MCSRPRRVLPGDISDHSQTRRTHSRPVGSISYLSQISRDTDATSYAIVVGGNAALFSTANLDDAHGPIVPTIIDSFGEACP
jgi:hypothetical protein